MKQLQPPIGIILTMPLKWFEETGHTVETGLAAMMQCMNEDESEWMFLKKSLPTQDFLYVYVVFDGLIQIRANLSRIERNASYEWADKPDGSARAFENKNWIVLCGNAITPPHPISMKGFQGFRYVYETIF